VVQDAAVDDGPREAVRTVWEQHGAKLWRSLLAYTGDPEIANDAMSEAFAQALGRGAGVRDHAAWIWRASFRIAAGELQRRSRTSRTTVEGVYEMPEPTVDLIRALRALSPNQRAVAVLSLYADLPPREIARVLGLSATAVRVHLSQARRRLRELLEDDDA
jgi:RNA polymerase sigma-70 factor (ECF subfamily)